MHYFSYLDDHPQKNLILFENDKTMEPNDFSERI